MANPIGIFIYGIFGRMYLVVMLAAVIVTFWVFKGLDKIGLLKYVQNLVVVVLDDTQSIARYCTPHMYEPAILWDCVGDPQKYRDSNEDPADQENASSLERAVNAIERMIPGSSNSEQNNVGDRSAQPPAEQRQNVPTNPYDNQ